MSKSKKIVISILTILSLVVGIIFFKLVTSGIDSNYLKKKISTYIFSSSSVNVKISNVRIKISRTSGLILDVPLISHIEKSNYHLKNTIIDINVLSILNKGLIDSDLYFTSNLTTKNNDSILLQISSTDENFTFYKILSENFYITEPITINKSDLSIFNISFVFSKKFINTHFKQYVDVAYLNYNINPLDLFFDNNNLYNASIGFDLKNKILKLKELTNKHSIKVKASIDYSKNVKLINSNLSIPSENLSILLETVAATRQTKNDKILENILKLSNDNQNLKINFNIDDELKAKDINVNAYGNLKLDYQFDQNADPSFLKGIANYDLKLYKKNITDDWYRISTNLNLNSTHLYIRQINLIKKPNELLSLVLASEFDLKKEIKLNVVSKNSSLILDGKIILSEFNDFVIDDFYISNNNNVDFTINGILRNRNLNGHISGKNIDLSRNKIIINDNIKDYYFQSEEYKIHTRKALLSDGLIVNNFKANIEKQQNQISVESTGDTKETSFTYTRKKDQKLDISAIKADNIINSVGPHHSSRKLIKNGKATISTYRLIGSLDTNVEIYLEDFILINTPATLKLLSLPSFSGISSAINNESGIEFAYGKIKYRVNETSYSDINAFAINDGIGLILNGSIDRKNNLLDLKGQISPLHLLSGIIQKIPFFGKLLIGNEGEGIVSVEYEMSGSEDNPKVTSNPLTIFKPRLFERTIDFLNNNF